MPPISQRRPCICRNVYPDRSFTYDIPYMVRILYVVVRIPYKKKNIMSLRIFNYFLEVMWCEKMGVFEKATGGNLNDVVYVYCNSSSFWFTYAYAI